MFKIHNPLIQIINLHFLFKDHYSFIWLVLTFIIKIRINALKTLNF